MFCIHSSWRVFTCESTNGVANREVLKFLSPEGRFVSARFLCSNNDEKGAVNNELNILFSEGSRPLLISEKKKRSFFGVGSAEPSLLPVLAKNEC